MVEDLTVIVVSGSFELGTSGVEQLQPDNSDLSAISQVLDNALLGLDEVILDLTIVNSIPGAVVGTAAARAEPSKWRAHAGQGRMVHGESRTPAEVGTLGLRFVVERPTVAAGKRPCSSPATPPLVWCRPLRAC